MKNQQYSIVRGDRSGVFFGKILSREGREVEIGECRRLWYWDGAASLSQLAAEGTKEPKECKFAIPVETLTVLDAIELIPCTSTAAASIMGVTPWRV